MFVATYTDTALNSNAGSASGVFFWLCLYVRACFVKIASVSSAWCLLFTVPRPPHTPPVNVCSHTPSSPRNRLHAPGRGQIDWCTLSLQKYLNSICLQWLQFPVQPKSALFFSEALFHLFILPTLPGQLSFHSIILCESTCPLCLLFIL